MCVQYRINVPLTRSRQYSSLFSTTRSVCSSQQMPLHSITDPPAICLAWKHHQNFLILARLSAKFNSIMKITCLQFCLVHLKCSLANLQTGLAATTSLLGLPRATCYAPFGYKHWPHWNIMWDITKMFQTVVKGLDDQESVMSLCLPPPCLLIGVQYCWYTAQTLVIILWCTPSAT
jgi:hypothetical protein